MNIYFDSDALIALVEGEGLRWATLEAIVYRPKRGLQLVISEVSATEVFVYPLRLAISGDHSFNLMEAYLEFFEEASPFQRVPIAFPLLISAARLRAKRRGLKTTDAIHLASAKDAACDTFLTNDRDLRSVASSEGLQTCSIEPAELDALLARIDALP